MGTSESVQAAGGESRGIEAWSELSTATVSDALDRHGIPGQATGVVPLDPCFRAAGRAYTVRMLPISALGQSVGDYIDDVPAGRIVVIDNQGRLDATVWGDLLTLTAHTRRIAGTVIHGVCRDVTASLELGYPIFSRGVSMRTGKDRVRAESIGVPVSLGGTTVEEGDIVLGDANGVVVVPRDLEAAVLQTAKEIEDVEARIRDAVRDGAPLTDARRRFGYHGLQRRQRDRDQ